MEGDEEEGGGKKDFTMADLREFLLPVEMDEFHLIQAHSQGRGGITSLKNYERAYALVEIAKARKILAIK